MDDEEEEEQEEEEGGTLRLTSDIGVALEDEDGPGVVVDEREGVGRGAPGGDA